MRNLVLIIAVLLLFYGCADPIGEVFFETESSFVRGDIVYVEISSGDTVRNENSILTYITYDDGRPLSSEIEDSITGFSFQFGPLQVDQKFVLHARYYDSQNRLLYAGNSALDSLIDGINKAEIVLTPSISKASISAEISYTDIVTADEISSQGQIVTNITSADDNAQTRTTYGSNFYFDSLLLEATYEVRSEYRDTINHIFYSFDSTLTTSADQPLIDFPIRLTSNDGLSTLKGTLTYTNPNSGNQEVVTNAISRIKFTNPLKGFSNDVSYSSQGSNFSFGPLKPDSYIREFFFQGETYSYQYIDTIVVEANEPIIDENILLEREKQTVFTGQIYYIDPTSGLRHKATSSSGNIEFLNPLKSFSSEIVTESTGGKYAFGPLSADSYIRSFTFNDGLFNYAYSDTITVDGIDPVKFEEINLSPDNETLVVGTIVYNHPISGAENEAVSAVAKIRFTNPLKSFDNGVYLTSSGSNFAFGPLQPDEYVREFSFSDGVFDYSISDTIIVDGANAITEEQVSLNWEKSTGLIVRVTDDLGNPLDGANVYLYKNYNFLLTYRDDPNVAIAHGVTGADGSVTFAGLDTGSMYVYATRIFASDTLTNISSNSTPISLVKDIVRTMNTHVE